MKVTNHGSTSTVTTIEGSSELKAGETYSGVVKERLSHDEAIVHVRGKDVQIKFEGEVPKGDRIVFHIAENDGKRLTAKRHDAVLTAELQTQDDANVSKILASLRVNASVELRQALQLVQSFSISIDAKLIEHLKNFLTHTSGTEQQKLDTIQALLMKNLELNSTNLKAVHAALVEKPLVDLVTKGVVTMEATSVFSKVQEVLHQLQHTSTPLTSSALAHDARRNEGLIPLQLTDDNTSHRGQQPYDQITSKTINEATTHTLPIQDNESVRMIHESVRGSMEQMLHILQNVAEYEADEALQALAHLPSKDYIVATVTEKLAQVAAQFKNVQREISRNLDNLQHFVQQARGNVLPQIRPLLENTLDLLDKTILKSDVLLFTDMKTEKVLLQSSSRLADARNLLVKGDYSGARQIFEDVKTAIRNIDFRPSEIKVQHYMARMALDDLPANTAGQRLNMSFEQLTWQLQNVSSSPKATYEVLRHLGLNHESEVAQSLSQQKDGRQEAFQQNMKATMLQLLKGETEVLQQGRTTQELQQLVQHITGQQLLSKTDVGNHLQSMLFHIPLVLGKQVEQLQVIVNSKQPGQKVDWENCSIYFLIETKKMGETGILLSATARNLAITLKNDNPAFRDRIEPLVQRYTESLKNIGYNIKGIQFAKLNPDVQETGIGSSHKVPSTPSTPMASTKGFDFKI